MGEPRRNSCKSNFSEVNSKPLPSHNRGLLRLNTQKCVFPREFWERLQHLSGPLNGSESKRATLWKGRGSETRGEGAKERQEVEGEKMKSLPMSNKCTETQTMSWVK